MAMQAGFLDRVFNSTISLPQQFLWRLWRVMEDDQVDLFSEEGIADAALIPGLGVFDDHQKDVMPDYMAKQMGMGDNFGAHLFAAIATDPLTYLTGGATALAKVGKAGTKAATHPAVTKALRELAETGGKSIDEIAGAMHPKDFLELTRQARQATTAPKEIRQLDKLSHKLAVSIPEAEKLANARGMESFTIKDAVKHTRDRQIALGLPGFATLGVKRDVAPGYGSWWKLFKDATNSGGQAVTKALHLNALMGAPGIGHMLAGIDQVRGGLKLGSEARYGVKKATTELKPNQIKAMQHWLNAEKGGAAITADIDRVLQTPGGLDKALATYEVALGRNLSAQDAFKRALNSVGVGAREESGAALYGRLTGRGSDSDFFPRSWDTLNKGTEGIKRLFAGAVAKRDAASKAAQTEGFSAVPQANKVKALENVYATKRADMGPAKKAIAERAFKTGVAARTYFNRLFITGESSKFGKSAYDDFLANVARDNDQLQTLTEQLYTRLNQIAEGSKTFSRKDLDTLVLKAMELQGLPEEIQASFKLGEINPSDVGAGLKAAGRFFNRHRRVTNTIEKLLVSAGLDSAQTRQKLVDLLDDPEHGIFPFLERERKLKGSAESDFIAEFDDIIRNDTYKRTTYTPQEKRLLRREHNKHVVRGHTFAPKTEKGRETKALKALQGRKVGTLTNDEIDSGLAQLEKLGQVKLTDSEILAHAEELPAIAQLKRDTGVTTSEAVALLRRTGKATERTVERRQPFWNPDKTTWTPKEIEDVSEPFGFKLFDASKEQRALSDMPEVQNILESQAQKRMLFDFVDGDLKWVDASGMLGGVVKAKSKVTRATVQKAIDHLNRAQKQKQTRLQLEQLRLGDFDAMSPEWSKQMDKIIEMENAMLLDNSLENMRGLRSALKQLEGVPVTARLQWRPTKVAQSTLAKTYKFLPGGHRSRGAAMQELREFLEANPTYVEKYGDATITYNRPLKIPAQRVDDAKAVLSDVDRDILLGRTKKFDDASLPKDLQADYRSLGEVKRRRTELPKTHPYYEPGPILGKQERVVTAVAPPRTDYEVFFRQAGVTIPEGAMSEWASTYAHGRVLLREVEMAYRRADKLGVAVEVDHRILDDLAGNMNRMGEIVTDMMRQAAPDGFGDALDIAKNLSLATFEQAQKTGTWLPGAPIGYIPRFFNRSSREKISKIIGNIEDHDGSLLARIGVKQGEYFARHLDEYSLDDVNQLFTELRAAATEKGASPELAKFHKELEDVMKAEGVQIRSLKGTKLGYTSDRIESDPFLSLVQRLGAANQSDNLASYFDRLLETGDKNGNALMLGGKVIGVLTDTGNTIKAGEVQRFRGKSVYRGKDGETVAFSTKTDVNEFTPTGFLIEDSAGKVHRIENGSLKETGFGLLNLGDISRAETGAVKPTLGNSFARASLRSDLHQSMFKDVVGPQASTGLLGNHVVFGSQNVMTSAVKAAARVHQVAPAFLRTADSINYMLKSFQTIFSVPFHIANLSSGVFQAQLAGASPKNIAAAYMDTVRLLGGKQDFADHMGTMQTLLGTEGRTVSMGIVDLVKGEKPRLLEAVRMHGNGELTKFTDQLDKMGVSKAEHLILEHADGSTTDLMEFMQLAGEMQLFGTFSSSLTRGSRTIAENLLRTKLLATDAGKLEGIGKRTINKMRNVAETSEVFNRTATALALVREGHPMKRAIEITKEAHVPYEKLTPFEQQALKRISVYYTFPRHYMPWAWTRFAEDPSKLARISHYIREQSLVSTQEGKPTLQLGDYRVDLGRLNANFEAAGLMAAFADRVVMPATEAFVPGVSQYDTRMLSKAYSDAGITNVGGVMGMVFGTDALSVGERSSFGANNMWEDATRIIWPIKLMAQLAGKQPTLEEQSPYVNYTPMEKWLISNRIWGLGVRKVRDRHELIRGKAAYDQLLRKIKLRMASTDDSSKKDELYKAAQTLGVGLQQLSQAEQSRAFK
jgi:hypothetical protein